MPTAKCSLAELLEFSFNVNVLDSRFIEFGKIEPPSNKLQHVSPRVTFSIETASLRFYLRLSLITKT